MSSTDHVDAAGILGVPVEEVSAVADSPAGLLITTTDGVTYVNVPETAPDADGKTGVMYLFKPTVGDAHVAFPVYAQDTGEVAAETPTSEGSAAADPDDQVPAGSIKAIVGWVHERGDDKVAERATRALAAEQAADKPRSSLIGELEQLAAPPAEALTQEETDILDQLDPEVAASLLALDADERALLVGLSDEDVLALGMYVEANKS